MKILCFGDSNTYGYDPRSFFGERYNPEYRWVDLLEETSGLHAVNRGENGREIPRRDLELECFQRILEEEKPLDLLIILLGTNDLLQGNPPKAVAVRMERFLEQIPLDRSRILLIAPPMKPGEWVPIRELIEASEELTREYRDLCHRRGISFADAVEWDIPLAFDGVHFTEEGHRIFAQNVLEELKRMVYDCVSE